jgi:hypothetical protein
MESLSEGTGEETFNRSLESVDAFLEWPLFPLGFLFDLLLACVLHSGVASRDGAAGFTETDCVLTTGFGSSLGVFLLESRFVVEEVVILISIEESSLADPSGPYLLIALDVVQPIISKSPP